MERLTEKDFNFTTDFVKRSIDSWSIAQCLQKLQEYENLEEQNLLLKLPCKVGTHIYIINRYWIDEGQIIGLAECDDVDCACFKVYEDPDTYSMVEFDEFGKTWFLTEEEAKRKLKEKMKELQC